MDGESGRLATYDLTNFTIRDMTQCGKAMRAMGAGSGSREQTAGRIVRGFYEGLVNAQGKRACTVILPVAKGQGKR
jgi:hypothetical protein